MPRGEILALPRGALQRAGVHAGGPPAHRDLSGGQPLPCLRHHWHFDLHQQEVRKHPKGRHLGVSRNRGHFFLAAFLSFYCAFFFLSCDW